MLAVDEVLVEDEEPEDPLAEESLDPEVALEDSLDPLSFEPVSLPLPEPASFDPESLPAGASEVLEADRLSLR